MKASTVAALERINRSFYAQWATEFSATRTKPWPGWDRVFEIVKQHLGSEGFSILDLGCGNSRLLEPLESFFGSRILYRGVDASVPLLALARSASERCRPALHAANLVDEPLSEIAPAERFDLIVAFGLMHHLPSFALRQRLVTAAASRLRSGGLMAVSFWQFETKERFRRRFIPWLRYSSEFSSRPEALEVEDLESGDHLLAWGDSGAVRYCHFADSAEAKAVVSVPELKTLVTFEDDGASNDLNLYWVLEKSHSSTTGSAQ